MANIDSAADLVVYSREGCHLCEQMIHALGKYQERVSFNFKVIDIDSCPELIKQFNDKVPVLMSLFDRREICRYHLNTSLLDDYLAKFR